MKLKAFVVLTAFCTTSLQAQWLDDAARAHLDNALSHLNMSRADLGFAKDHAMPDPVLSIARRMLRDPLQLSDFGERLITSIQKPETLWPFICETLDVEPYSSQAAQERASEPAEVSKYEPLARFYSDAAHVDALLEQAFRKLTPNAMDYLLAAYLYGLLNAEENADARHALLGAGCSPTLLRRLRRESRALDPAPAASNYLAQLRLVNAHALVEAGRILHAAVRRLASNAAEIPEAIRLESPLGAIVVGTRGADHYSEPALLILDPGGNDVYTGFAGVADGRRGARISVVVDLDGDDAWIGNELLGPGAAAFGMSVIYEAAGADAYSMRWAGAAAALCGVAICEDRAGADRYESGAFGQGAAIAGVAVLRDEEGNDRYEAGLAGQAFAGVNGFALLLDDHGHDVYYAGGREPDYERNDDRFLSFAQGFAMGMRPWAGGGVAALVDGAGNDAYLADVFGQGASYWYALGLLADLGGNDTYRIHQYGQGAGIHLSSGLLADASGDDQYVGFILVQGAGHDYAVGMLLDGQGRDTYTADHHAQGRALNNALALLVDHNGDDAYFGRQPEQCQGIGNDGGHREYGSLALLLDLGGADRYTCGAKDGARLRRPDFGIVYDVSEDTP